MAGERLLAGWDAPLQLPHTLGVNLRLTPTPLALQGPCSGMCITAPTAPAHHPCNRAMRLGGVQHNTAQHHTATTYHNVFDHNTTLFKNAQIKAQPGDRDGEQCR